MFVHEILPSDQKRIRSTTYIYLVCDLLIKSTSAVSVCSNLLIFPFKTKEIPPSCQEAEANAERRKIQVESEVSQPWVMLFFFQWACFQLP